MLFSVRKIAHRLHLWLGLVSGAVIFTVCVTGAAYAFKDEILDALQPWRFVEPQSAEPLAPSAVQIAAAPHSGGLNATAITYGEPRDAVRIDYFTGRERGSRSIWIDPYGGQHLKTVEEGEFDFFAAVLRGHRTLWLPRHIGKPIIGWSVVMFLVCLVTGAILWWPKRWSRRAAGQRLSVETRKGWGRLNFDLHNVLGGYAFIFLTAACLTGLVWSFGWYSRAAYRLTSGGKEELPYIMPASDTTATERVPLDTLYNRLRAAEPAAKGFYFSLPTTPDGPVRVSIVHRRRSYYRTDNLFFDRYTMAPLQGQGPYAGRYRDVKGADRLRRMNLEIHDGRILGLPGRILMFFAALIGASLPVTGVIIWLRRRQRLGKSRQKPT